LGGGQRAAETGQQTCQEQTLPPERSERRHSAPISDVLT
jgi:hypothetical protein